MLNAKGQFVRGLTAANFAVFENDEAQAIDVVAPEAGTGVFSRSWSTAARAWPCALMACARRRGQLLEPLAPEDEVLVAPFSRHILASHRSDDGPRNRTGGHLRHHAVRVEPRFSTRCSEAAEEPGHGHRRRGDCAADRRLRRAQPGRLRRHRGALRNAEVTLYVIGVGGIAGMSLKGESLLTELADDHRRAAPGFRSMRSGLPSPTRRWPPTSSIATC